MSERPFGIASKRTIKACPYGGVLRVAAALVNDCLEGLEHTSAQNKSMATSQAVQSSQCQSLTGAVGRCPPEILGNIFLHIRDSAVDDFFKSDTPPSVVTAYDWLHVTLTCRYWYDVALGFPSLWSAIICGHLSNTTISTFIARSRGTCLRVFISEKAPPPAEWPMTIPSVQSEVQRFPLLSKTKSSYASALLISSFQQRQPFLPLAATVPSRQYCPSLRPSFDRTQTDQSVHLLEALRLLTPHYHRLVVLRYYSSHIPIGLEHMFRQYAPQLRELMVGVRKRPFPSPSIPPLDSIHLSHLNQCSPDHMGRLTKVQIHGQALSCPIFWHNVFELLKRNPGLRQLELCGPLGATGATLPSTKTSPVVLQHLHILSLANYGVELIQWFLSNVVIHKTTRLVITHNAAVQRLGGFLPLCPSHIPGLPAVISISIRSNRGGFQELILRDPKGIPVLTAAGCSNPRFDDVLQCLTGVISLSRIRRLSMTSHGRLLDGHTAQFWQTILQNMISLHEISLQNVLPHGLVWLLLRNPRLTLPDYESEFQPSYCIDDRHRGHVSVHITEEYHGELGGCLATLRTVYECRPGKTRDTLQAINDKHIITTVSRVVNGV